MLMKVVVLYRPNSEFSRRVEDFARDLEREHMAHIDLVNIDTRDGYSTATLYDVMQNPAVLVLGNDGRLIKEWQGADRLPPKGDISYYANSY